MGSHCVSLTLPADLRRNQSATGRLSIPYLGSRRYTGKGGRAELRYDSGRGRWYFHHSVEVADNRLKGHTRAAAIDLGVRNLASLSIDGEERAINLSGREVLADYDYWGRCIAAHQRELSHRPKGERSSRRLRRLCARRRDRLRHALEAIGSRTASTLAARKVGVVYIGWPNGIRRDANYGRKMNGRIHNFFSFEKFSRIIEKHLLRAGIAVERVGERGTSSTCPCCGSRRVVRRPWSVLRCKEPDCAAAMDSDVAGSRNILKVNRPGISWNGAEAVLEPELHQWDKHHWWRDAPNPLQLRAKPERPAA